MMKALWDVTQQFQNKNGSILVSGKIYIYFQGRTALATTYHDEEGTVVNSNPVLLDNNGRATVFADTAYSYTIVVCDYYGKELFSQDITLHDVTETADEITIIGSDGSILINRTTADNVKTFDLYANTNIIATKQSVDDLASRVSTNEDDIEDIKGDIEDIGTALSNKKDKQTAVDESGSATKTITRIQQNANGVITVTYEDINLPNDVTITSSDNSINVTDDGEGNFDLSVNFPADTQTYGVFTSSNGSSWNKISGNIDSIGSLDESNYHYTIIVPYAVGSLSNAIAQISLAGGILNDYRDIDLSYGHNGCVEFSADKKMTSFAPVLTMPSGVSIYPVAYLFIHSIGGTASGGGSGDNDKVAVDEDATPGYLADVLVSDSDLVSLVKSGNVLHVQVNTEYSADPKLSTCDESVINSATSNYGSYSLNAGYDKLIWDDTTYASYSWCNAIVYQMNRLCTSQGTITKANLAICGSVATTNPPAWLNVGVFATDGTLLGQTGLKFYGTDFTSGEEMVSFDMIEEATGSLNLDRNTHYIVQVVHCGLQLAGLDRTDSYNYSYDVNLRQNLQGTVSQPKFPAITDLTNIITCIPYVTFGAEALN